METSLDEVLNVARIEILQGKIIAATDRLVECLDALLLAGDASLAGAFLSRIDPAFFPPEVSTGMLTVARTAREVLGQSYSHFLSHVLEALDSAWKLPPERRDRIAKRFQ